VSIIGTEGENKTTLVAKCANNWHRRRK